MGRIYSLSFTDLAISASGDLFQIQAQTVPAIIHSCYISQTSDVGDAAAENLPVVIRRLDEAVTDIGSGVAIDGGDTAPLAKVNMNRTTDSLGGSVSGVHSEGWNVAQTFIYLPPPELRPTVGVGESLVVNLRATPTDALDVCGTIYWEEFGK